LDFESYTQTLIQKGTIPGLSILMAQEDNILFKKHYGWKSLYPQKEPLHEDTLYDVASLTKPLITSFLILYLIEKKYFTLKTKIKEIFPEFYHFGDMNLMHLLTHSSGLPAWYPFYLFGNHYLDQFNKIELNKSPGKRVVYSCPGYILLYYIIQKVSGADFIQLANDIIFQPLDLKNTFLKVPETLKHLAAPTEKGNRHEQQIAEKWARNHERGKYLNVYTDFKWRDDIIQGETHDLYSYHLGGTAGNTGLFSTSGDLFRLSREFFPGSASILATKTLEYCYQNYTPFKRSHRSIGFKLNSSLIGTAGRTMSRQAFGHNGFTGTSIWMDLAEYSKSKKDTVFILLSNRVHPNVTKMPAISSFLKRV
jgi:serine-type D-Ala-D-Ala carboxypeptidase